jgi:cell division protein FtsW
MIIPGKVKQFGPKRKIDFVPVFFALVFSLFGLLMIYEASNVTAFRDFGDKYHYVKEQAIWLVIGVGAMVSAIIVPYKKYISLAVPLLVGTIISLFAVFLPGIGIRILGAHRWIGFGNYTFQPSELSKLALIIYLSSWFSVKEKKRFFSFLILFGIIVGLVMLQPDMGTAVVLTIICIVMYFLSGAPLWQFLMLMPVTLVAVVILAVISPYRFARVTTFLNPNFDPLGASYHIRQILISFGSGGLFGVGLGASRQKYEFLPEATTDSIFAIIGEEFGFIGAGILIILIFLFLIRLYRITRLAPDRQSQLLSGGIFTLLGFQTLINLGAMVAVFPLTGIPLPFFSYGGSNLVITLVTVGIIVNVSRPLNK